MEKLFTLTFILFSFFARADYWTQKADFGGAARQGAIGFSIGTKGYLGTGQDATFDFLDFWEYNPLTNVWTQKANCGGMGRFAAVGFSIYDKGYISCGELSTGIYSNDLWEYDAAANTWAQKANLGGIGRMGSVSFSLNDKGYIGTGYDITQANLKDFWEYDPLVNAWTQKMDVGGMERFGATGFSDGTKGYLGTGYDDIIWPAGKKDFWEWNSNTNAWTQKADFGLASRSEDCAFWLCPYGYIGLGTTTIGSGTVSDFWKYNVANNSWTQAANFGNGLREMAVAFSIGNKGYVGTGWINDQSPQIDFWEYTPDSTCITGLEGLSPSSGGTNLEFSISPNPAKEFIVISLPRIYRGYPLTGKENIVITITDIQGKKVYESKLQTSDFRLSTSNFQKGIYLVELTNAFLPDRQEKQKVIKKFVKE